MSGIILTCVFYLLISVFLLTRVQAEALLIPLELLFGNPEKTRPQISPDGKRLAYLAPLDGVLNVWVKTLSADDGRAVTKDTDRGIESYFWGYDNVHLFYVRDTKGDENWRLYSVDLNTEETKELTPFENVQVRIVEHNQHVPGAMLIAINQRHPVLHDVYHINLQTGELKLIEENPGNVTGWIADPVLNVRGAVVAEPTGTDALLVRESASGVWKKLASWTLEDSLTSRPIGFTKDGSAIYLMDSRGANTGRLIKMDIGSGEIQVMAEDPEYDIDAVLMHPDTYDIQMVSVTKARREWTVLDPAIDEDIRNIRSLDEGDFMVTSRDLRLQKWTVGFGEDEGPAHYYLYDAASKKSTFLFSRAPALERYQLARMEPISFKSRDGFTIHGYLTVPPGAIREGLPTVLLVHGGPWSRNRWGYDSRAQWLANRGYVCLQVNFRGSTGYGKAFANAGDKEWGGKMHEDLVDVVNWAAGQGISDPERIAIFGTSYGGYAALVGAAFTPDLFRCAVSVVGPSNLISFIDSIPPYWKTHLALFQKRVGDPRTEEEFLKSRSPLFHVDQIKIPILIAQGANDPRVKRSESEQIVEAMKEKGIDYEYLLFEDEGHGFVKPENRIKFYAAAERFLAKHLGGRYEE